MAERHEERSYCRQNNNKHQIAVKDGVKKKEENTSKREKAVSYQRYYRNNKTEGFFLLEGGLRYMIYGMNKQFVIRELALVFPYGEQLLSTRRGGALVGGR